MTDWQEELHPRGPGGKFASKGEAAETISKRSTGEEREQMLRLAHARDRELFTRALKNKGYTYDVINDIYPTHGYVVSPHKDKEETHKPEKFTAECVHNYMNKHIDFVRKTPNAQFGAWVDRKTGKVFLDVVRVLPDKATALNLAREHKQLAIWSLHEKWEYRTDETEKEKPKRRKGSAG